MTNRALKFCRK